MYASSNYCLEGYNNRCLECVEGCDECTASGLQLTECQKCDSSKVFTMIGGSLDKFSLGR